MGTVKRKGRTFHFRGPSFDHAVIYFNQWTGNRPDCVVVAQSNVMSFRQSANITKTSPKGVIGLLIRWRFFILSKYDETFFKYLSTIENKCDKIYM